MMLSREYRERIEHRFYAFCKAVLHNEACNYYRERKRKIRMKYHLNTCKKTLLFAPHSVDEYFVLQDKPIAFTVNA